VKKQQAIVAGSGIVILIIFYFFGNTVPPLKKSASAVSADNNTQSLDIKTILNADKSKLSPVRQEYVNRLENAVVRGDVKDQQIKADLQLADFWKDSIENGFLPYSY
jgi:hypothetical protein